MKKYILATILSATMMYVQAQEILSLEQCRQMAIKQNKEIAAAAKQSDMAKYMVRSYRGNFFPDISLTGTGLYNTGTGTLAMEGGLLPVYTPDATGEMIETGSYAYFPGMSLSYKVRTIYSGGVSLEQPIYMGGKIINAFKMAKIQRDMAGENERLTTTDIILQTDEAYAGLVKANELKAVAEKYMEALNELMKNVQTARKHGMRSQNDVLKVQVKLNECELSVRRAENAIRLASMNLCHYIGCDLRGDLQVESTLPEPGEMFAAADITSRPEYVMLDQQVQLAARQVKLNRSELLPQIGFGASYNYMHGFKFSDQYLFHKGTASLMLNVTIPVFHFGERINKVKAAKAQLEQTRLEQENKNQLMQLELTQAINNLDEAQLEKKIAERSLEQAEENMRVSRSQFNAGLETLSDHLEAQALWQQAYETKVDASFQLYIKYIAYLKAAGKLL